MNPVSSPFALIGQAGISAHQAAIWLFLVVVLFWAIYTLISIYHWIRFSHASLVAIPAIGTHIIVSAVLILFAVSGLS